MKVGSCEPNKTELQVLITPDQNIKYVFVFTHLQDQSSGETTGWDEGTAMDATGTTGLFRKVLKSGSIQGSSKYASAFLLYQFVVTGKDGSIIGRSEVFSDISLSRCGTDILIQPPRRTLIIPSIPTPSRTQEIVK